MPYSNPDGLIAAALIVQAIVLTTVILRFVSRRSPKRQYLLADWLILIAAVFSTGLVVLQVYGAAANILGVPVTPKVQAHPERANQLKLMYRQYEFASVVGSLVTTGIIKISVSLFYLHIFSTQKYRRVIKPWVAIMVAWTLGFLVAHLALCGSHGTPASSTLQDPKVWNEHCGNGVAMGRWLVVSSAITDLVTVLLPLPMVMSLQLALHQKISLAAIFLVGLLSVGASTARAYIYITVSLSLSHTDYAINITSICVWNLVEIQMGIIAACAPTLRPVLHDAMRSQVFISLKSSASTAFNRSGHRSKSSSSESESDKRSLSLPEHGTVLASAEKSSDSHLPMPGSIEVRSDISVDYQDGTGHR